MDDTIRESIELNFREIGTDAVAREILSSSTAINVNSGASNGVRVSLAETACEFLEKAAAWT